MAISFSTSIAFLCGYVVVVVAVVVVVVVVVVSILLTLTAPYGAKKDVDCTNQSQAFRALEDVRRPFGLPPTALGPRGILGSTDGDCTGSASLRVVARGPAITQ